MRKATLGDLVTFRTGKLNSNAAVATGQYPFFTCSQETYRIDSYSFDTECVLLAGNNAAGIYPLKYYKGRFDAYQRTYVIEPVDRKILSTRFLYYLLRPQLERLQTLSTGAATKFLTLSILKSIEVSLPELDNQRRIASILAAYDDLIENNTRRIAILEEMARRIYEEWFVRFRFPGHEHVKMVDSELGLIPEGWRVTSLGRIAKKGGRKFVEALDDHLPLVDLARIPRRSSCLAEFGRSSEIKTSRLVFGENQVLYGAIRPNFHKVLLAPFEGVTNVSVHIIEAEKSIPVSFLHSFLFSDRTVAWTVQHSGGMKMPTINWDVMKNLPLALPPDGLRQAFHERVYPMLQLVKVLVRKNFPLRKSRDLLLPKLISGELDVSTLPEPEEAVAA